MTSFFIFIFVGLVSISGIAINAYIIFVIIKEKQVNSVNGLLLVQTSAVELALSITVIACSMPSMVFDNLQSSSIGYCTVCGFFISFLRPVSLWTLCGLNCDRYYAISAPLHYGSLINSRKVLIAISITWISSLILGLPTVFGSTTYKYDNASFICTPNFGRTFSVYYSVAYTTLVFILPLILILTCNLKVFTIARYHKHRIASAIFEVTLSAQVTITHQKNPFSPSGLANRFKGRSASLTVIQLIGSFLIVYVPYFCIVLWNSIGYLLASSSTVAFAAARNTHRLYQQANKDADVVDVNSVEDVELPSYILSVASILLFCSSSVNGFLYGVKNRVLKKSFQNYWRKKMTKNELNQEIQARTPSTCGSRRPSLTPAIGFFARQAFRRPSDVSLDTQKSNLLATSYPRFQAMNTNFSACRPGSSPGLESSIVQHESFNELKRTQSFRATASRISSLTSLKFPPTYTEQDRLDDLRSYQRCAGNLPTLPSKNKHSPLMGGSGANLLLQRFRKTDCSEYEVLNKSRSKSPRILITRAYSEENDNTSANRSSLPKTSSSVTTLLIDAHWNSASRECIAFNTISRVNNRLLLTDYTDDSWSEESQEELFKSEIADAESRLTKKTVNEEDTTLDPDRSHPGSNHSFRSWSFSSEKKNIQFKIGSVVLSERNFSSLKNDDTNDVEEKCLGNRC